MYLFVSADDAAQFYESGYMAREFIFFDNDDVEEEFYRTKHLGRRYVEGVRQCGFDEVTLFRNGHLLFTKQLDPLDPETCSRRA
jgi:hypothetical protein